MHSVSFWSLTPSLSCAPASWPFTKHHRAAGHGAWSSEQTVGALSCTCMHIHMHANIHTGTCTHGDMHMLANIFTQIHTWGTCVHMHVPIDACTRGIHAYT